MRTYTLKNGKIINIDDKVINDYERVFSKFTNTTAEYFFVTSEVPDNAAISEIEQLIVKGIYDEIAFILKAPRAIADAIDEGVVDIC